jgi:hypothetical protein
MLRDASKHGQRTDDRRAVPSQGRRRDR